MNDSDLDKPATENALEAAIQEFKTYVLERESSLMKALIVLSLALCALLSPTTLVQAKEASADCEVTSVTRARTKASRSKAWSPTQELTRSRFYRFARKATITTT